MSYTQAQYAALCASIAEGATKVKYQDKEVEYRSLKDMITLKGLMESELFPAGLNNNGAHRTVSVYGSGL